ncbi:MAG TPA: hypothetical protein VNU46_09310 [Gemmatimonadaceae bacterium]|nr:hypothetical protein [Gemmatimonadaceae bacterium]
MIEQQDRGLPGTSEFVGFAMYRLLDTWLDSGVVTAFSIEAQEGIQTLRKIIGEMPDSEARVRTIFGELLTALENAEDSNPFAIAPILLSYGDLLSRSKNKSGLTRYVTEHLCDVLEMYRSTQSFDPNILWHSYLQCANAALDRGDIEEAEYLYSQANKLAIKPAH